MRFDNNTKAFLALVRAGLWEEDVWLSNYEGINLKEIYRLAQEQSVVGLVAAGLEHAKGVRFPKEEVLTIVGEALRLEQRNIKMNVFIAALTERLRKNDLYSLLVKGQGIAQCYERPLWRASGDIDLLFDECGFIKAKKYFDELVGGEEVVSHKNRKRKHIDYNYESNVIEIHGTLHSGLSKKIDRVIDEVQDGVFSKGEVRTWDNNGTKVFRDCPKKTGTFQQID